MELILFVGLPGAGKSTFYRERFVHSHDLVSKDLMPRSSDKRRRQRTQIVAALAAGRSVVVDNTNASRAERAEPIEVARSFGVRVIVYRFTEDVADCLARNALREGAARVPPVAIYVTERRFEAPAPEEGIDAIHTVRLGPEGFIIEE